MGPLEMFLVAFFAVHATVAASNGQWPHCCCPTTTVRLLSTSASPQETQDYVFHPASLHILNYNL